MLCIFEMCCLRLLSDVPFYPIGKISVDDVDCEAGGEECCQPSRRVVFSNLDVFTPTEEVVGLILNKITQDAMSGF